MKLDIYVDGSYSKHKPDVVSGGIIIVDRDCNKPLYARRVYSRDNAFTSMNNVGGELVATVIGMTAAYSYSKVEEISSIRFFHDYIGIDKFITGGWKAKAKGAVLYVHAFNSMRKDGLKDTDIRFVKVKAHSGNKYNEMADEVAKGHVPYECREIIREEYEF